MIWRRSKVIFLVTLKDRTGVRSGAYHVITNADDREAAKRKARTHLLGNSDEYTVTPLTKSDDLVIVDVTL